MLKPRKIIRDYTPDYKALNNLDKQTKNIQDLYDQVSEFYKFLSEPAFRAEIKGEQGPQGEQGERGHDGAKGDKGATGNPGPQGSTGPRGADGLPGLPGPTGPQGPEGIPGPEGPRGPRGYTGLQGPQGLEGVPGEKGNMGEPWALSGVFDTFDELQAEAVRADAKLYLVASMNDENGDLYVYREKYNDFIFLNNVIYDLAFQIVQGPSGRNYFTFIKGKHYNEYGDVDVTQEETLIDEKGYLHTNVILNYLKGNGIKSTQWNEDLADSHTSTLVITFDNGTTATITVKNGKGIDKTEKTGTNVLVDSYRITYSDGTHFDYTVTNGKGINKIEKTSTDVLTDTYTIYWNDNTTTTYLVTNGRGIVKIELTNTTLLVDTYTITWNDNTTSTYTVTNGRGITSIDKTGRDSQTLEDIYTITYNDNTTFVFRIKSTTPYEEAVKAGYDKSIKTFYGIINGNIWIGPGQNYSDVYDNNDYKYENININNPLNIECIQDYIYVIYPADSEFMFNLTMNGFPIPMEPVDTTTIQDYYILKSVNQYDGNFNITI